MKVAPFGSGVQWGNITPFVFVAYKRIFLFLLFLFGDFNVLFVFVRVVRIGG